jgi:catabolite regulation protein CreA
MGRHNLILCVLLGQSAAHVFAFSTFFNPPRFLQSYSRLKLLPMEADFTTSMKMQNSNSIPEASQSRRSFLSAALFATTSLINGVQATAFGSGQREIGEISASGIIFKDTIKVTAFQDPKVDGVQIYVSDFQRPINERLAKNFFSDPSYASIGCAKTSNVVRASKDIYKGKDGEEVFEQARSLLFKTLRVRRWFRSQRCPRLRSAIKRCTVLA